MIAAPVGTQVDGYTVAPSCGARTRDPLCLTHGETFPDQEALAQHLKSARGQAIPCVVARLCGPHGIEEVGR
jgi:hypothetical protein